MNQVFVFGSSSAYGVGGKDGGWADLLKCRLHGELYGVNGRGEKWELFNFGKSGAKIAFAQETVEGQLKAYKRDGLTIALVSIGGNNAKAENDPANFVSTVEEYTKEMTIFLTTLKRQVDHVFFVGSGTVDESKTNPKISPFSDRKSYFTNARRALFDEALRGIAAEVGVTFIELGVDPDEWKEKYLYIDGLHPNQAGHQFICDKVWEKIAPLIK